MKAPNALISRIWITGIEAASKSCKKPIFAYAFFFFCCTIHTLLCFLLNLNSKNSINFCRKREKWIISYQWLFTAKNM
jgi:hypothetical protein